jgi:hypothetical protein
MNDEDRFNRFLRNAQAAQTEVDLLAGLAAECDNRAPLTLVLRASSAVQLAGLIQLALRHPGVASKDHVRLTGITFLEHIRAYFADAPATLEILRRGDDPEYDQ